MSGDDVFLEVALEGSTGAHSRPASRVFKGCAPLRGGHRDRCRVVSVPILTRRRVVSTRRMHDTRALRASQRRRRGAALGRAQGPRVGQADAARRERRVRLRQVAVARDRLRRDRQGHQDVDVERDRGEGDREARNEARRPVAEVRDPSRPTRSRARPDPRRRRALRNAARRACGSQLACLEAVEGCAAGECSPGALVARLAAVPKPRRRRARSSAVDGVWKAKEARCKSTELAALVRSFFKHLSSWIAQADHQPLVSVE